MKRTSNIVFSLTGIFISERFRFLSILQFPKKNPVFVAVGDCTALSNRNSLRDDSLPSPLHSPQGQKSPFWITPQERRPFPHPIPENPKAKCFPNRFLDFQQPVSLCCTSEQRPVVASQPTFRRWNTTKLGLDSLHYFIYKNIELYDIIVS